MFPGGWFALLPPSAPLSVRSSVLLWILCCESKTHRSSSHAPSLRPSVRFVRSLGRSLPSFSACLHLSSAAASSEDRGRDGGSRRGILSEVGKEGREAHGEKSIQFPHARKPLARFRSLLAVGSRSLHFLLLLYFTLFLLPRSGCWLAAMPIPSHRRRRHRMLQLNAAGRRARRGAYLFGKWQCVYLV